MFQDLKSILHRSLRQKGISGAVEAAQVVEVFKQAVADKFSPSVVGSLRQVALRGDTLQVSAGSSALAAELRMREKELTAALADRFSGKVFRLNIFG